MVPSVKPDAQAPVWEKKGRRKEGGRENRKRKNKSHMKYL